MEGIVIREMSPHDLPEVCAVAKCCFTTPWQLSVFDSELKNTDAVLKVAQINNRIAGYICLRSMYDTVHIMDFAVMDEFRRAGIGSLLLSHSLHEITGTRPETKHVTLEVRRSNTSAIRLYQKFGFTETGRRRGYYQKPFEDAVIMQCDLNPEELKR